jgi:hypothetical protein
MNWKFILIITILIAILGVGTWLLLTLTSEKSARLGEEVVEQESNEIAGWETYENFSMGFSMQYDSEKWEWRKHYFIKNSFSEHPEGKESFGMILENQDLDLFCLILFVRSTPYNPETREILNFEALVLSEKEIVEKHFTKDIIDEEVTLRGISGRKLSYVFSGEKINRIFIPLQDNETFQVAYYREEDDVCDAEFEKMFSTFKFISQ